MTIRDGVVSRLLLVHDLQRCSSRRPQRRQALTGLGLVLAGGASAGRASAQVASAGAAGGRSLHPDARPGSGLTSLQLAGQRIIGSYAGLTPPATLLSDIRWDAAGVIFFGDNSPATPRSPGGDRAVGPGTQQQSPVTLPLLLMTDQEGGQVAAAPRAAPLLSEKQIGGVQ